MFHMSSKSKSQYLQGEPITCVQVLQLRGETLFSDYILSSEHPLGNVTDHVIKIEFQGRGTSHAHCLL